MNGLLHRMIERARDRGGPRIEPLLAPRFAHAGVGSSDGLTEIEVETSAPAVRPIAGHAPLAGDPPQAKLKRAVSPSIPPREANANANGESESGHTHLHSPDVPAARGAIVEAEATPDRRPKTVSQWLDDSDDSSNTRTVIHPITPVDARVAHVAAPDTAAKAIARDIPAVRSPADPASPAFEEHTQAITISIGHVQVHHAAPPPAPAPARRAAFRPGVSLDAFLRRGGSDR